MKQNWIKYYTIRTYVDTETGEIVPESQAKVKNKYIIINKSLNTTYHEYNNTKYGKREYTIEIKPNPQQYMELF